MAAAVLLARRAILANYRPRLPRWSTFCGCYNNRLLRPVNIFLSYPREYSVEADTIAVRLRVAGHSVFFAPDQLSAAGAYDDPIRRSLRDSDLVIFLLGPEFFGTGRYTLTELDLVRKKWPSPAGRVLPVLMRQMPIDTLPGYLRAISILEPKGDAAAEIIAEVRELRRRSRRSWLSGLAAPAVISFLVLALGTTFFVKNYWQLRSRMTAMLRGSASTRSSAFTVEPRAEHLFKDHAEGWGVSPE